MKTKSTVITLFCAAAATAIAFAGCGGYTPEEGTETFTECSNSRGKHKR